MKRDITGEPTTDAILARTAEIDGMRAELAKRDVIIIALRQAFDAAAGPHCPSCGNSIDPDTCHCGMATNDPGHDNHTPVPMGCVCGYVEPDWQALATTRGEHIHRQRVELAKHRASDIANVERWRRAREIIDEVSRLRPVYAKAQQWRIYPRAPGAIAELERAIDAAIAEESKP